MPSRSKAQSRIMQAAAHTPGGFGGVPQSVGKDFAKADHGKSLKNLPEHVPHKAKGGVVNEERRYASKAPPAPKRHPW